MQTFLYTPDIPLWAEAIPGVWPSKRGKGGRVPFNASNIMGIDTGDGKAEESWIQFLLRSPAMQPWVVDMIMDHQLMILRHSIDKSGSHAWSPPGSGKTLCGLVWLAAAVQSPKVVITKAAARGTWKEEIRKFTRFRPKVLAGKKELDKGRIIHDPRAIYITAWETLIDWKDLIIQMKPHSLVMDEIHWAKNNKRVQPVVRKDGTTRFDPLPNTAAAIKELCKATERRFGMTATPIPNRTRDLWAQLDLAEPWGWGSFHDFGVRYCGGFQDTYGWKYDDLSNEDELLKRLQWSRYKTNQKAVSKNLPPKRRQILYLDRDEQNRPASVKRDIQRAKNDREAVFEVMLQEAASRKRKYIISRVVEAVSFGQKVVVFTGRRADCDRLGKDIAKKVTNAPVFCAHGGTSAEARDKIRHAYMDTEGAAVLIGTGDAWGESINLQDTDLALFVMLPWTPRAIRQWEGRFSRLGQKRAVLVCYVIASGTVDEHVADILLNKLPAVGTVAEDETLEEIEAAFDENAEDLLTRVALKMG